MDAEEFTSVRGKLLKAQQDGRLDAADAGFPPFSGELKDRGVCAQCCGAPDGTERQYEINGQLVWLHRECRRFYAEG